MEYRAIETNGITLNIVDHGGNGPILILMPGLTANARFFDAIVHRGLGESARVVAVDLRGRGLSDKPDTGYSMEDHAADITGLIRTIADGQVIVGGHSFGGLLTYFLAATEPELVSRCIVLDAPFEVDPQIVEQIRPSLERLDKPMPSFDSYLTAVRSQPYFADWWDPSIEAYYRADVMDLPDGAVKPRSDADHIEQAIAGTLEPDWPAIVASIHQPTLVVRARGAFGPPGSPPILGTAPAKRLVASLHDGRLVEVDGNHITGFFGNGASQVADAIRSFIIGT